MNLLKFSTKTVIDSADIQYLGNTKQLLDMITEQSKKHKDAHFLILRSGERHEIALCSFEGKIPEFKMPDISMLEGLIK